jgi:nucleotide-binding universal stress UspA family protein
MCSLFANGISYPSAGVFGSRGLVTPNPLREILEGAKIEAQQWLKIDEDNNIRLQAEVVVTATSIVSAIVEYAKNKNVHLIIMGTRGRSGFKKLLLGGVASRVVAYSTCLVMIVKLAISSLISNGS